MNALETDIPDVLIIEPKLFGDQRGFFLETYQFERYAACGISRPFTQDNLSRSARGVLRGLHLQNPMAQGKLQFRPTAAFAQLAGKNFASLPVARPHGSSSNTVVTLGERLILKGYRQEIGRAHV